MSDCRRETCRIYLAALAMRDAAAKVAGTVSVRCDKPARSTLEKDVLRQAIANFDAFMAYNRPERKVAQSAVSWSLVQADGTLCPGAIDDEETAKDCWEPDTAKGERVVPVLMTEIRNLKARHPHIYTPKRAAADAKRRKGGVPQEKVQEPAAGISVPTIKVQEVPGGNICTDNRSTESPTKEPQ